MLYNLNNVVCQLYINKAGENKEKLYAPPKTIKFIYLIFTNPIVFLLQT